MTFINEAAFENALINELKNRGWESEILKNPTEADLRQNWADILFQNNRGINRLNDVPLPDFYALTRYREATTTLTQGGGARRFPLSENPG